MSSDRSKRYLSQSTSSSSVSFPLTPNASGSVDIPDDPALLRVFVSQMSGDLREHIRSICIYTLFSTEWSNVAESLTFIAGFAEFEEQELSDKATGSLWDREDICIRFILEEGKLNLILRLLDETNQHTQKLREQPSLIETWMKSSSTSLDPDTMKQTLFTIEEAASAILRVAFRSEESLQTCDMGTFFDMSSRTFDFDIKHGLPEFAEKLPFLYDVQVLHLLALFFNQLDRVQDDRAIELLIRYDVAPKLVEFVDKFKGSLPTGALQSCCEFLSSLISAELYKSFENSLFPTAEDRARIVSFKEAFLDDFAKDATEKKKFRPLLDAILRFKMRAK